MSILIYDNRGGVGLTEQNRFADTRKKIPFSSCCLFKGLFFFSTRKQTGENEKRMIQN